MLLALELLAIDEGAYLSLQVFDRNLRPAGQVVRVASLDVGDVDGQVLAGDGVVRYGELTGYE